MNLEEFKTQFAEQQSGGQSQKAFCREKGIPYTTFLYWRRKSAEVAAAKRPFVEIPISGMLGALEIRFPNGVSLSLPPGCPAEPVLLKALHAL